MIIEGFVAPGFESLRALYERNMHALAERNTQLCVYVGDECVADLWASAIDDTEFSGDSLVNVFSSGKTLEAIALGMLEDRGVLQYGAKVADYWPEYGAQGKHDTTVADVMRHEAGLAAFDVSLEPEHLLPEQILDNAIGAVIEQQAPRFRSGNNSQREYHAITRGWIAGEIFRRAEPSGRSMGQFLREEVSAPLGCDVYIGLQEAELARLSKVQMLGFGYQFAQGLVPRALGRKMELNLAQLTAKLWRLRGAMKNSTTRSAPPPIAGLKKVSMFDDPTISMGEMPSAGAKASARGLARLAAVMANGGELSGQRLLSDSAHRSMHQQPVERSMLSLNTRFTQAGLATFSTAKPLASPLDRGLNNGREGYFGWMGLGGSIFQWHPEHRIGFAYVPTSLNVLDIVNERGKAYQAEVVRCVTRAA